MKACLLLAVFVLAATYVAAAATLKVNDDGRLNGENGWYVPQINGLFVWMAKEEGEKLLAELEKQEDQETFLTLSSVTYYLYTKSNPYNGQEISADYNSVSNSYFNANNPTRFIIHGWTQSYQAETNNIIRDAWLSVGEYNVIIVDWSRARSVDYASSVVAIPGVGKQIASMVDYLVNNHGLSLDDIEVIGHSLGAHVAGFVGKNVATGQVRTITGLDPALPLFSYDQPDKRLNQDDAYYVESIQTNGGKLGFLKPIGKGAFYPNGGKIQPGCGVDLKGSCSHQRSCVYYAEAVQQNNFPSVRCTGYEDAVKKSCGSQYSSVKMGAVYNYELVAGEFYVPVRSTAPYGYGG